MATQQQQEKQHEQHDRTRQADQTDQIEKALDLFTTGADPSVLRTYAEAWRRMAHDLKATIEGQDQEVARLGDNWTGAASDSFRARWTNTRRQAEKLLPHFAIVAERLDHTADTLQQPNAEQANEEHVHRGEPVGGDS
ncbi:WXG100 family type VII secretion target [Streptomyces sp. S186]|uniref:WXG100 family type VII secretion target n=1 Tax=Streptomyces sp. S186 TaxID=3434395 RepID=UPI003F66FB8F